ncbi:hypothetical protein CCACVL1_08505 [Corchorus capsularis]|uniref:Uncharacterized protein n=1 Tax=Corchorus capsularis TaxID=210143 RepID=A0A1R3J095_COCAP|nr:hypothetical protein CCACVL1_08505 [Corchorus capsularis]
MADLTFKLLFGKEKWQISGLLDGPWSKHFISGRAWTEIKARYRYSGRAGPGQS